MEGLGSGIVVSDTDISGRLGLKIFFQRLLPKILQENYGHLKKGEKKTLFVQN